MTVLSNTARNPNLVQAETLQACTICGGRTFAQQEVLWPDLIRAWDLNPEETRLINRQQGYLCQTCGANLRSMTLAGALMECFDWYGTLDVFITSPQARQARFLEINPAGSLHQYLKRLPQCQCLAFPQTDMQALDLPDDGVDYVVHSDTLEHVPDPVQGLRECRRVLRPNGCLLFTIPIVPTRLTRRRDGLAPCSHGSAQDQPEDYRVITEYGADFYLELIQAGWKKISLYSLGTVASLAVIGIK
ncbi:MAG: class I SAM-dependent methyltransferase [candidate division FCPU426 bacterium]